MNLTTINTFNISQYEQIPYNTDIEIIQNYCQSIFSNFQVLIFICAFLFIVAYLILNKDSEIQSIINNVYIFTSGCLIIFMSFYLLIQNKILTVTGFKILKYFGLLSILIGLLYLSLKYKKEIKKIVEKFNEDK